MPGAGMNFSSTTATSTFSSPPPHEKKENPSSPILSVEVLPPPSPSLQAPHFSRAIPSRTTTEGGTSNTVSHYVSNATGGMSSSSCDANPQHGEKKEEKLGEDSSSTSWSPSVSIEESEWDVTHTLDTFAKAKITNFIQRVQREVLNKEEQEGGGVGGKMLPLSPGMKRRKMEGGAVGKVEEEERGNGGIAIETRFMSSLSYYFSRVVLPIPSTYRSSPSSSSSPTTSAAAAAAPSFPYLYAEGCAPTAKDAELVACMHAERLVDACGYQLFQLSSKQKRHAEAAAAAGRWAPLPVGGDASSPLPPEVVRERGPLPFPIQYIPPGCSGMLRLGGRRGEALSSSSSSGHQNAAIAAAAAANAALMAKVEEQLRVHKLHFASVRRGVFTPLKYTLASPYFFDGGSVFRIKQFLQVYKVHRLNRACWTTAVHKEVLKLLPRGAQGGGGSRRGSGGANSRKGMEDDDEDWWEDGDSPSSRNSGGGGSGSSPPHRHRRTRHEEEIGGMSHEEAGPSPFPPCYIAQLRLPIDARFGERVCVGKARTRREAVTLACMHAELTIDALGLMLYPQSPEEQRQHALECRQVQRWCVEPGEFDFRFTTPSPPALVLESDRELSAMSDSIIRPQMFPTTETTSTSLSHGNVGTGGAVANSSSSSSTTSDASSSSSSSSSSHFSGQDGKEGGKGQKEGDVGMTEGNGVKSMFPPPPSSSPPSFSSNLATAEVVAEHHYSTTTSTMSPRGGSEGSGMEGEEKKDGGEKRAGAGSTTGMSSSAGEPGVVGSASSSSPTTVTSSLGVISSIETIMVQHSRAVNNIHGVLNVSTMEPSARKYLKAYLARCYAPLSCPPSSSSSSSSLPNSGSGGREEEENKRRGKLVEEPFLVEALGQRNLNETFRATVSVPLWTTIQKTNKKLDVEEAEGGKEKEIRPASLVLSHESFVGIGISDNREDAETAASMHALHTLAVLNQPWYVPEGGIPPPPPPVESNSGNVGKTERKEEEDGKNGDRDPTTSSSSLSLSPLAFPPSLTAYAKIAGWPVYQPSLPPRFPADVGGDDRLPAPVRCLGAHVGRISAPGLAADWRRRGHRLMRASGQYFVEMEDRASEKISQESNTVKDILQYREKIKEMEWSTAADVPALLHRILVPPDASPTGRNYVHTLTGVRQPDLFAVQRLKDYLERHGKNFDSSLSVGQTMADGGGGEMEARLMKVVEADPDHAEGGGGNSSGEALAGLEGRNRRGGRSNHFRGILHERHRLNILGSAPLSSSSIANPSHRNAQDQHHQSGKGSIQNEETSPSYVLSFSRFPSPAALLWVVKVQLPLPLKLHSSSILGPLPRCVAVGESYQSQQDALCMCAMHAELMLDNLGIPLYDHPLLQRKHADTARTLGRWAPLQYGLRPPPALLDPSVLLPPPLRREHPHSLAWQLVTQCRKKEDLPLAGRGKKEGPSSPFAHASEHTTPQFSHAHAPHEESTTILNSHPKGGGEEGATPTTSFSTAGTTLSTPGEKEETEEQGGGRREKGVEEGERERERGEKRTAATAMTVSLTAKESKAAAGLRSTAEALKRLQQAAVSSSERFSSAGKSRDHKQGKPWKSSGGGGGIEHQGEERGARSMEDPSPHRSTTTVKGSRTPVYANATSATALQRTPAYPAPSPSFPASTSSSGLGGSGFAASSSSSSCSSARTAAPKTKTETSSQDSPEKMEESLEEEEEEEQGMRISSRCSRRNNMEQGRTTGAGEPDTGTHEGGASRREGIPFEMEDAMVGEEEGEGGAVLPPPTSFSTTPTAIADATDLTDEELCDIATLQSVHPRELFRQAFKHVQFYFNSKGSDFQRTLRTYTVRDERHGIVHRAVVDIPLPEGGGGGGGGGSSASSTRKGYGRRVGVGCAAVKKLAPLLCACHVAWTLDTLNIPIYRGRRQHLYATLAKEAGRHAPFPGDPPAPFDTPSPKGLCCLSSVIREMPDPPPPPPTTEELQRDRRLWMQYVRAVRTYLEKKKEYDLYDAMFDLKRAPRSGVPAEDDTLAAVELLPLQRQARSQLPPLCRSAGLPPPELFRYEPFGKLPQRMFLTEAPVLGTPFTARGLALSGPDSIQRAAMHYAYIITHIVMKNTGNRGNGVGSGGSSSGGVGTTSTSTSNRRTGSGFGSSSSSLSSSPSWGSRGGGGQWASTATTTNAGHYGNNGGIHSMAGRGGGSGTLAPLSLGSSRMRSSHLVDPVKEDFNTIGKHTLLQLFAAVQPPFRPLQWTFKVKTKTEVGGASTISSSFPLHKVSGLASTASTTNGHDPHPDPHHSSVVVTHTAMLEWIDAAEVKHVGKGEARQISSSTVATTTTTADGDAKQAAQDAALSSLHTQLLRHPSYQALLAFARRRLDVYFDTLFMLAPLPKRRGDQQNVTNDEDNHSENIPSRKPHEKHNAPPACVSLESGRGEERGPFDRLAALARHPWEFDEVGKTKERTAGIPTTTTSHAKVTGSRPCVSLTSLEKKEKGETCHGRRSGEGGVWWDILLSGRGCTLPLRWRLPIPSPPKSPSPSSSSSPSNPRSSSPLWMESGASAPLMEALWNAGDARLGIERRRRNREREEEPGRSTPHRLGSREGKGDEQERLVSTTATSTTTPPPAILFRMGLVTTWNEEVGGGVGGVPPSPADKKEEQEESRPCTDGPPPSNIASSPPSTTDTTSSSASCPPQKEKMFIATNLGLMVGFLLSCFPPPRIDCETEATGKEEKEEEGKENQTACASSSYISFRHGALLSFQLSKLLLAGYVWGIGDEVIRFIDFLMNAGGHFSPPHLRGPVPKTKKAGMTVVFGEEDSSTRMEKMEAAAEAVKNAEEEKDEVDIVELWLAYEACQCREAKDVLEAGGEGKRETGMSGKEEEEGRGRPTSTTRVPPPPQNSTSGVGAASDPSSSSLLLLSWYGQELCRQLHALHLKLLCSFPLQEPIHGTFIDMLANLSPASASSFSNHHPTTNNTNSRHPRSNHASSPPNHRQDNEKKKRQTNEQVQALKMRACLAFATAPYIGPPFTLPCAKTSKYVTDRAEIKQEHEGEEEEEEEGENVRVPRNSVSAAAVVTATLDAELHQVSSGGIGVDRRWTLVTHIPFSLFLFTLTNTPTTTAPSSSQLCPPTSITRVEDIHELALLLDQFLLILRHPSRDVSSPSSSSCSTTTTNTATPSTSSGRSSSKSQQDWARDLLCIHEKLSMCYSCLRPVPAMVQQALLFLPEEEMMVEKDRDQVGEKTSSIISSSSVPFSRIEFITKPVLPSPIPRP